MMLKITVEIDGMTCGMCESHINDTIRSKFEVKKVTSFHTKGQTVILTEHLISEDALHKAIADTGYTVTGIHVEVYQRKKLFGLF